MGPHGRGHGDARDPMGGGNWDTKGGDMGTLRTPWEETTGILKKGTWGPGDPVGGDTELLWVRMMGSHRR